MRVLHLTRDFPPRSAGGISTAVGALVRAQRAAGLDARVVSFDDWRPTRQRPPSPPQPLPQGVLRVRSNEDLDSARRFVEASAPDILHAHHAMLWPWTAELRRSLGTAAVKTIHVIQAIANEWRGIDDTESARCQRQAIAEADRILVASHVAAAALLARFPDITPRLRHCSIAIDGLDEPLVATAARDPHLIAYAGRFDDMKGTDVLFDVMVDVLARHARARFEIAGGVPLNARGDGRWRRQLAECLPAPLAARVDLRGWLDPASLRHLFRRAAVVVAPSRFETFGLSVAEAMREGAAVIGSYGTAHAELIENDRTGKLVAPGDPRGWADAALALLDDPEQRERLAATGAAEVRDSLTPERAAAAHIAVYRELGPA